VNEHGLRDQVSDYLKTLAPDVFAEKRWGGAYFGRKGVSDYVGLGWGIPFALELKHPNEPAVLNTDQAFYQEKFQAAGGMTMCANKLADVVSFMRRVQLAALARVPCPI
jgi:hypothetical protein